MNTTSTNTVNTANATNATNDMGMIASLLGCAVLSVAILANAFAAPTMPIQKMDTIVVTAKRAVLTQAPTQLAHITLAPMVITAQRISV